MELAYVNIILGVVGAIIMLLLAVIGFFLRGVNLSIKTLESTVNSFVTFVEVDKVKSKNDTLNCDLKHKHIDDEIGILKTDVADIKIRVIKLEK